MSDNVIVARRILLGLHSNSGYNVRAVPEAHIASIASAKWRIPGHSNEENVNHDVEDDDDIPSTKARSRKIEAVAAIADEVDSDCESKVED